MNFARILIITLLAVGIVACGPASPKFQGSDVTGGSFGRDFKLTDAEGRQRTIADFRGKVVVMFFGYTQCPDACPTTLSELATVMQTLGADAARVQVLFVTIDPERDTAELLAQYAGIQSDASVCAAIAGDGRGGQGIQGALSKRPNDTRHVQQDHSAGTPFDPDGRLGPCEPWPRATGLAHDIGALLHPSRDLAPDSPAHRSN